MPGWTTNGLAAIAGAALTGAEQFPIDTEYAQGISPQSAAVSLTEHSKFLRGQAQNGPNFRNFLDGGDFGVNPWQRGTAFSGIAGTPAYTADRWFARGASTSSISVSQASTSGALPGLEAALQFGRATGNSDVNPIFLGQAVESADSWRAQGQSMSLSFWAKAGANFSAAEGALVVQLVSGTEANQSAANLVSGAWSGQADIISATAELTSAWQRFQFTGVVPAGASQLGVLFSYAPVGTAGAADAVQIAGVQLEVGPAASAFEFRDAQVELDICQRYCWVVNEPAATVVVAAGMNTGASAQLFYAATPVQLRAAPQVSFGSGAGAWKANLAGTATAIAALSAGSTHTPNAISLVGDATGATAGQAALLQGGGGAGQVIVSADL